MESYDFSEKAKYRTRVWNEIGKRCSVPRRLRRVVYLDTREALETIYLLDRGHNPANLLAVNRDPVEVAMLTSALKKRGYPAVKTAGVEWIRAIKERLHEDGAHILNFDGMGCLHHDLMSMMRESIRVAKPMVVAVNMLGGRETGTQRTYLAAIKAQRSDKGNCALPNVTTFGRTVNANHAERVRTLVKMATGAGADIPHVCSIHVTSIAWDVYMSTAHQPMVWSVWQLGPHYESDTSWHGVEKEWCIAPECVYLNDPNSYRTLVHAYQQGALVMRQFDGMTIFDVEQQYGTEMAAQVDYINQFLGAIALKINAMDRSINSPFSLDLPTLEHSHG